MTSILPGLESLPNIHPILVHFPVALLPAALLLWLASLRKGSDGFWTAGCWILWIACVTALAATGTGLWAEHVMGHTAPGHEAVHAHKYVALAATVAILAASLAAALSRNSTRSRGVAATLLVVAVALVGLAADRGAFLVYGRGLGMSAAAVESYYQHEGGHQHEHEGNDADEHHGHGESGSHDHDNGKEAE